MTWYEVHPRADSDFLFRSHHLFNTLVSLPSTVYQPGCASNITTFGFKIHTSILLVLLDLDQMGESYGGIWVCEGFKPNSLGVVHSYACSNLSYQTSGPISMKQASFARPGPLTGTVSCGRRVQITIDLTGILVWKTLNT